MTILLALTLLFASGTQAVSDVEVWNEGVGYYEAGDVTNALRVLRPLMLSKSHGPRAAEVVAALEHARGNREEAAVAAQLALRAAPKDPRAARNFTRAVDGLLEDRAARYRDELVKTAEGKDPGALLKAATEEARRLFTDAGTFRTNAAPRAVALADQYEKRALKLADAWVPVRAAIASSVTNEQQAATILAQLDAAEAATKTAARELGDLEEGAYASMSRVEHDFTRFLKLTILPPQAMEEDLIAQSNAWQDVEVFNTRAWQPEALEYTRAFRAKFPMWARAYEQQAAANTNQPPFTAEAQAKVSALATELEKVQLTCCEKNLPPEQERAIAIINEIRELLPKEDGGGQGQGQGQGQAQDRNPPKNESQGDEETPDETQGESQGEDEPTPQPEENGGADEPSPEREQLEALLKKAQERTDEHEAEKKARMRKAPLPPNERDW